MMYDMLALIAIWMVGTAPVVILLDHGVEPGNPAFQAYLLALGFGYLYPSWRFSGQTLGMRAWKIRLVSDQKPFRLRQALLRYIAGLASLATFGLGFAWSLVRADRRAWPDLASDSRLIVLGGRSASEHPKREAQK